MTELVRAPGDPAADQRWLSLAIRLSQRCERSDAAFSVGAILVAASGEVIATGWSRETDPADHAEELALRRATDGGARPDLADGGDLATATLYSSLEPCCRRSSRPLSCAELIVAAGIRRVVIAWREPPIFQPGGGLAWLTGQSVTVVEVPGLAGVARAVNSHLLGH